MRGVFFVIFLLCSISGTVTCPPSFAGSEHGLLMVANERRYLLCEYWDDISEFSIKIGVDGNGQLLDRAKFTFRDSKSEYYVRQEKTQSNELHRILLNADDPEYIVRLQVFRSPDDYFDSTVTFLNHKPPYNVAKGVCFFG